LFLVSRYGFGDARALGRVLASRRSKANARLRLDWLRDTLSDVAFGARRGCDHAVG